MGEVFEMAPASSRALWLLGGIAVLLAGLLVLFAFLAHSSQNASFEVTDQGIRIRGDLFGRLVPATAIVAAEARRLDLRREPELAPRYRTFGTGLPGYASGWFRLRNGQKALLYLTDRKRAVYVPTRAGYGLLLSPVRPDAFVEAVRRIGS